MAETAALVDSLHPLEVKVLAVLSGRSSQTAPPTLVVLRDDEIAQAAGLEPSQVSMAVEWLLTKSLLRIESEKTSMS